MPEGLSMDLRKISAFLDWQSPKGVHGMQHFLSFAIFYRQFIKGFSGQVAPINALLKKGTYFTWTLEIQAAFKGANQALTSSLILIHPNPAQPFLVETDASSCVIGDVLTQESEAQGHLYLWHYFSRKLTPAKINYNIMDLGLLAIQAAFEKWWHHLEGAWFLVQEP